MLVIFTNELSTGYLFFLRISCPSSLSTLVKNCSQLHLRSGWHLCLRSCTLCLPQFNVTPSFSPSFFQGGKRFDGLTSSQIVFWSAFPWKTLRKELGIGGLIGRWSLTAKGRKWGNLNREGGKAKEYMLFERVTSVDCWGFICWEPSEEPYTSELLYQGLRNEYIYDFY